MSAKGKRAGVLERVVVPPGAPPWVTAELIWTTIETWQPYYPKPLTEHDALCIVLDVGRLLEVVQENSL